MDRTKLAQIENLVKETFDLWEVKRVGFSWQHYYLNHTYRIRNLSLEMGKEAGTDLEKLEYAAILHDITKRYDGVILTDANGKRVINEDGFWLNEMLKPARNNWVTELYDSLNQWGEVHHISGAVLTEKILEAYGFPEDFRKSVAYIVRCHLKSHKLTPDAVASIYKEPETQILYDADTIDPNLGLTAFYRNIQINAGGALARGTTIDLKSYIEGLPRWVATKEEFINHMISEWGRRVAANRYGRNQELNAQLNEEKKDFALNEKYGILAAIKFLMTDAADPSLQKHARLMREAWIPERERMLEEERDFDKDAAKQSFERAKRFLELLEKEVSGEL